MKPDHCKQRQPCTTQRKVKLIVCTTVHETLRAAPPVADCAAGEALGAVLQLEVEHRRRQRLHSMPEQQNTKPNPLSYLGVSGCLPY
jgi:hypothetical protein